MFKFYYIFLLLKLNGHALSVLIPKMHAIFEVPAVHMISIFDFAWICKEDQ